jgi:hypothetical protein
VELYSQPGNIPYPGGSPSSLVSLKCHCHYFPLLYQGSDAWAGLHKATMPWLPSSPAVPPPSQQAFHVTVPHTCHAQPCSLCTPTVASLGTCPFVSLPVQSLPLPSSPENLSLQPKTLTCLAVPSLMSNQTYCECFSCRHLCC